MADLYDMRTQGGALTNQKPPGICKLPGCDAPVWVIDATAGEAYDFCKRRHAKEYVQLITEQWELADRVCKFEPCSNHVHVDEKTKEPSNYCGHEHDFAASAAMGKLAAVEKRKQEAAAAKGGSSASQDALIVRPSGTGGGIGPTWGDDLGQKNIPLVRYAIAEAFLSLVAFFHVLCCVVLTLPCRLCSIVLEPSGPVNNTAFHVSLKN